MGLLLAKMAAASAIPLRALVDERGLLYGLHPDPFKLPDGCQNRFAPPTLEQSDIHAIHIRLAEPPTSGQA